MKTNKLLFLLILVISSITIKAQTPFKFNYQTVIRDNTGAILANQNVKLRIKLYEVSTGGAVIYQEEHNNLSTNEFGLVFLQIGSGNVSVGSTLDKINWSQGEKWLENELSIGNNGFNIVGQRSQLVSVPFAINAENAKKSETAVNAITAQTADIATKAINSDNAVNATNAVNSQTADLATKALNADNVTNVNLITAESTLWNDKPKALTNEWVDGDVEVLVPENGKYLLLTEARAIIKDISLNPNIHAIHARVVDTKSSDPNAEVEYIVGINAGNAMSLPVINGDATMLGHQFLQLTKGTKLKLQFFAFSNTGLKIFSPWVITGPQSLHLIRLSN